MEDPNKPEPFDDVEDNVQEMDADDKIETMVSDLALGLIDLPEDQMKAELKSYNLSPDWEEDILQLVHDIKEAEATAAEMPQNADFAKEAEADAQAMANEDSTPVTVTEDDTDGDGDTDTKSIQKDEPKNDDASDNSSEEKDKPHDSKVSSDERLKNIDNSTNSIARHLASYRW
ncbi:MAG: hypothetical protein J6Y02_03820 [Pseudobutyrivibrio sp.]|nr:hypothetical protein [Pseudobutyrivibrio sp.]